MSDAPAGGSPYDGAIFSNSVGSDAGSFSIAPANATITITDPTAPPKQAFAASLAGSDAAVTPTWSLADFSVGSISAAGVFTPNGMVAGDVIVLATYGSATAQVTLHVAVNFQTNLANATLPDGTAITQGAGAIVEGDLTALQDFDGGTAALDGGIATKLVYPYDQTVLPRGLLAPVVEFEAGSVAPVDFKLSLDTTEFHWDGFGHVGNPSALLAVIPQTVWDGALQSARPDPVTTKATVTLSLVTATHSVAHGPSRSNLTIAQGKLTGIIYYESYGSDRVERDAGGNNDGTDFGLWSVKPGTAAPPTSLQSGCVLCHGVSASGNTLTTGTESPMLGPESGVYRVEADGGYTHLATAPEDCQYSAGSRGLGWGVVSPDGKVVLRGLNQFWGGEALAAWAVPDAPLVGADGGLLPLSTTMTVHGDFNMFVPSFSVDGQHLVYINAANTFDAGTPSESVGVVDTAIVFGDGGAGNYGSVTLTNRRTIYESRSPDGGAARAFTKVPTFLPDSQTIVIEETLADDPSFNHMLPDFGGVDGALYALQPSTAGGYVHTAMANANAGHDPKSATRNYEPKALPVEVGGYYWVVFASMRVDAYPSVPTPKKLWVTAISAGAAAGSDPSHPPFTLTNQSIVPVQPSQRGYWALAPCQVDGASCATGDDCCDGSCRPQSGTDPSSPLVCQLPLAATCAGNGDPCRAGHSEDCCGAATGVTCIGTLNGHGKCEAPAPK